MKAMLLAAGRGERLKPLTDHCPKPLVPVAGKPLIAYVLESLHAAGVQDVIVNLNWLGEQIETHLNASAPSGMRLRFSWEREQRLETGGGIFKVLDEFDGQPFLVVNADVYSNIDLKPLVEWAQSWPVNQLAHLVLADNPQHHPDGDFALTEDGTICESGDKQTFTGISVLHPDLFAGCQPRRFALAPLLRQAIAKGKVTGQHHKGLWTDVGTLERLQQLEHDLKNGLE